MWLTSKSPTALRTARGSAMRPPPGHGYSPGMSHPPKSTILALSARWVALSAVFLSAGAAGAEEVAIGVPFRAVLYPLSTIGTCLGPGQTRSAYTASCEIGN